LAFLQSSQLVAQSILQGNNLRSVQVDQLSDTDIKNIKAELRKNNTTLEVLEPLILQKGMSLAEFNKLKTRVNKAVDAPSSRDIDEIRNEDNLKNTNKKGLKSPKIENIKIKDSTSLVFGSQLFDNPTLNFEPNLQLATPVNYILGPGDELQISVYGVQEYNGNLSVSKDGVLQVPNIGDISVAGITIEAATQKIRSVLSRVYRTIPSGQSQVSVSIAGIRTIQVTIIGSKLPGNYAVSSLATVYNALFLAGGPGTNGSYRKIELIRDNQVYRTVDLYQFLVSGDQSNNLGLKANDVIRIPTYERRVTLEGEVKRPGIFEVIGAETFADVLRFASGFTDNAYTASVNVIQKTNKELKVLDIDNAEFDEYLPNAGDLFNITKILERYSNRITVEGAVFRPDVYSYQEGMRVADLIARAEGLKEDAYASRARILRLQPDLTLEVVNVDLTRALAGDPVANLEVKREDVITVYSILDFVEEYNVTVGGEVRKPGEYIYYDGLSLNDLILQAGGLTGAASKRVEVARMLISDKIDSNSLVKSTLFNIEITPTKNEQAANFELKPFDVVSIRKMPVYERPEIVTVTGSVSYTGPYALVNKKESVYDVIKRAGGLTALADVEGVKIKRPIQTKQIEEVASINLNLGKNVSIQDDLEKKFKEEVKFATIPVDWLDILKNPESNTNITLFPGDEIDVAAFNEGVKVAGNVLLTSEIPYEKGKSFRYYINAVGGTDSKGWKKKSYIIYPNGKAAVTSSFLFFRNYPKVLPGSQIIVPEKPESNFDTTAIAGLAGILVSLAGVVIAILR
jgi:protein involved in polysaccharide export with SLBB domain